MEQETFTENPAEIERLGRKSWTAYIWLVLLSLFILIPITFASWHHSWKLGLVVASMTFAFIAYQILLTRSYNVYYDDAGVWVYSGVLPWNKGIIGVKWRDLDDAGFYQTFWSWLFNSYSIRIGHRFTKSSEIFLTHIHKGNETVIKINDLHHALVSSGNLL